MLNLWDINFNPSNADLAKWSDKLKQFVHQQLLADKLFECVWPSFEADA